MAEGTQKRKSRKVQTEWTKSLTNQLIEAVEKEPSIWDATSTEYKDKGKRDFAWAEMSETPKNLNTKKSGQGTDENFVFRWEYFGAMKFLKSGDGSEAMDTTSNLVVSNLFIYFL